MSHFMKTSGPSGLAKPRGPGAPCRRRSSALQDRDEDVRHRSHSRSQHMRYAIMSEIAEALAHVQLELTSLTKAIGGRLGGALAEAWPGERRQEDLPAFELVLRVRDRMAVDQFLGTGKRLLVERGHTAGKAIHPGFEIGVRNRAVDPTVPLGGGGIKIGGAGNIEVRDEEIRIGAIEHYHLQVRVLFELANESLQLQHGFRAEHVDRRVIESRAPVGRVDLGQFELGLVSAHWCTPSGRGIRWPSRLA